MENQTAKLDLESTLRTKATRVHIERTLLNIQALRVCLNLSPSERCSMTKHAMQNSLIMLLGHDSLPNRRSSCKAVDLMRKIEQMENAENNFLKPRRDEEELDP